MQVIKTRNAIIPLDRDNHSGIIDYKSYVDDSFDNLQRATNYTLYDNTETTIGAEINPTNAVCTVSSVEEVYNEYTWMNYNYVMPFVAPKSSFYQFNIQAQLCECFVRFSDLNILRWDASFAMLGSRTIAQCSQLTNSALVYAADNLYIKEGQRIVFHFNYVGDPLAGFTKDNYLWTPDELIKGKTLDDGTLSKFRFRIRMNLTS